jgi:hypothetical protein
MTIGADIYQMATNQFLGAPGNKKDLIAVMRCFVVMACTSKEISKPDSLFVTKNVKPEKI